jgi:molybdopterin-guanine dinucleotide biosynthesis protein A
MSASLPSRGSTSGIVLAGGRSRRFGGDKLGVIIDGRPLLAWAVEALAAACDDVIIVTAQGYHLPEAFPTPVRVVSDDIPFGGPLSGTLSGARAAQGHLLIVAGGDMPRMEPPVLRLLLAGLEPAHEVCVLGAGSDDDPHLLPMAMRRQAILDQMEEPILSAGRPLRSLLDRLDVSVIPGARWRRLDPSGATLVDIDSPSDLGMVSSGAATDRTQEGQLRLKGRRSRPPDPRSDRRSP